MDKKIPVDELALLWVSTMIHYLRVIPRKLEPNSLINELIIQDLFQFKAIANQLEMLRCTRPFDPWAKYHWRQNFTCYLLQIIRRSQLFFQHLSDFYIKDNHNFTRYPL